MTRRDWKTGGFTLVEILVVLAILAVLIAIAVPTMTGALNDAKEKGAMYNARSVYIAYEYLRQTQDVKSADIANFLGIEEFGSSEEHPVVANIYCLVRYESTPGSPLKDLWYWEKGMPTSKFVHISVGGKAEIIDPSSIPPGVYDFDDRTHF